MAAPVLCVVQDNVQDFTRPWFAWVNSLFGSLILRVADLYPSLIFK
ncbi:metal-independent alpha-mannosidase [archaeon]|nr:MAG: metal-independent alpha-mannosidase [archaeon]